MKIKKVAVTGMGAICSLGHHLEDIWKKIVAGKSGIFPIEKAPCIGIGGQVQDFSLDTAIMEAKDQPRYDRFLHFSLHATNEALKQAGLDSRKDYPPERMGAIIGVGMGGLPYIEKNYERFLHKGSKKVSPFFIPSTIPSMASGILGTTFDLKGINFTVSSACASAAHALSQAFTEIALQRQDVMVSGGCESVFSALPFSAFTNMKALSRNVEDPTKASRPFDRDRDGFIMSEGAGILILEDYDKARARGAKIFAQLVGHGSTCDAHHITAPHPRGEGALRCMKQALESASISAEAVGHINAHGTSTPLGDAIEIKAVREVFGKHALKIKLSSTKSMIGHCLGAAGGLESIFCIKSLCTGIIPPTINLQNLDENCEGVDHVANTAQKSSFEYALNNSFGFGGTNSSLIFKKSLS